MHVQNVHVADFYTFMRVYVYMCDVRARQVHIHECLGMCAQVSALFPELSVQLKKVSQERITYIHIRVVCMLD